MDADNNNVVWVFNGANSTSCSAIFSSRENAEEWIHKNPLTELLTLYPINVSVYDWAINNEYFSPKKDLETTSEFMQKFTSASQEHYHYLDGELD